MSEIRDSLAQVQARCPFCKHDQCLPAYANPGTWVVVCISCGAHGPEAEERDAAVNAWNASHGPELMKMLEGKDGR
jgi:Zn ribbon nucleic-acid-binding protein